MGKYNEIKNLISQHVGNLPKNAFVVTYFRIKTKENLILSRYLLIIWCSRYSKTEQKMTTRNADLG